MRKVIAAVVVLAVAAAVTVLLVQNGSTMTPSSAVVPAPVSQVDGEGSFDMTGATASGPLSELLGLPEGEGIVLRLGGDHRPEGYTLRVTTSGITMDAADEAGLFHAIQTLQQ